MILGWTCIFAHLIWSKNTYYDCLCVRFWVDIGQYLGQNYFFADLIWSENTYPPMDRSSGDVVDEGAKVKSSDLQVFVGDHLHKDI